MNRGLKILLVMVAALLIVCLCSCVAGYFLMQSFGQVLEQAATNDPVEVAAVGDSIAEYQVPAGYHEEFGMSLFGFAVVGITPAEGTRGNIIMLMQFPEFVGMDRQSMEEQMRQSLQNHTSTEFSELEVVGQETVIIRDQNVTMTIYEGSTSEGERVRQMIGVFEGNEGTTMLMIMGPADRWDQRATDGFINSIR